MLNSAIKQTEKYIPRKSLAICWALIIAVLCGIPGKDIPHISFLELLSFDKWVHASVFFFQTWFTIRAFKKTDLILLTLICVAYGGLLEILQGLIFVDRSADLYDFIANSVGCLVAYLFCKKQNLSW